MKEIKDAEFENIIIDCSIDILEEVLRQAQQVGIMSEKNKIIVTSLVNNNKQTDFFSRDRGREIFLKFWRRFFRNEASNLG